MGVWVRVWGVWGVGGWWVGGGWVVVWMWVCVHAEPKRRLAAGRFQLHVLSLDMANAIR